MKHRRWIYWTYYIAGCTAFTGILIGIIVGCLKLLGAI
jgi:hypothetical protein